MIAEIILVVVMIIYSFVIIFTEEIENVFSKIKNKKSKEDFKMTRNELKNGMVVKTRDGRVRLITDNGGIYNLPKGTLACVITDYNQDLTSKHDSKFDIVEVYADYTLKDLVSKQAFDLDNLVKGNIFKTKKGNYFIVGKIDGTSVVTATNMYTGYVWILKDSFVDDDVVVVYDSKDYMRVIWQA